MLKVVIGSAAAVLLWLILEYLVLWKWTSTPEEKLRAEILGQELKRSLDKAEVPKEQLEKVQSYAVLGCLAVVILVIVFLKFVLLKN